MWWRWKWYVAFLHTSTLSTWKKMKSEQIKLNALKSYERVSAKGTKMKPIRFYNPNNSNGIHSLIWNSLFVCHLHAERGKFIVRHVIARPAMCLKAEKIPFNCLVSIFTFLSMAWAQLYFPCFESSKWFRTCLLNGIRIVWKIQFLMHTQFVMPLNHFTMDCCSKNEKFMHLENRLTFSKTLSMTIR